MKKILLAERLTHRLLTAHRRLIAASDACCAVHAHEGSPAVAALADPRWVSGDSRLFDRAEIEMATFADAISSAQEALSFNERQMLTYGLEAKLRPCFVGLALLERCAATLGASLGEVGIRLVADDPFLRDSVRLARRRGLVAGSSRFRGQSPASALRGIVRERVRGNRLRGLLPPWRRRAASHPGRGSLHRGRPRAALFALTPRSAQLFSSVARALEADGWDVPVIVHSAHGGHPGHLPFQDAHQGRVGVGSLKRPRWQLSKDLVELAPFSRRWLVRAADGAWITGQILTARHRFILQKLQPDVVITYGHEILGLSLKAAADELGVPTLFMPHGVMPPVPSSYYFFATATAVYGQPCIDANLSSPWAERARGMVVTGAPHYDEIFHRVQSTGTERVMLPGLRAAGDARPIVLFFATWGLNLLQHSHQLRSLRMMAEALPRDAFLVCKLHPSREERSVCESVLAERLPRDAYRVVGEREYRTAELLSACHVAVTVARSMSLVDSITAGRPVIGIVFSDLAADSLDGNHPAKNITAHGALVDSPEDLRRALTVLIHDEAERERLLRRRASYVERFLTADGQASKRVAQLVKALAFGDAEDVMAGSGAGLSRKD